MESYSEEIVAELQGYRTRLRPSIRETEKIILNWLDSYAFNSMELCRIVNGIPPNDFKGCNYSVKEKPFFSPKGMCKHECRRCRITARMIHQRLTNLQKQGKVYSLKLQWIDGRGEGAVSHQPTDIFRIWFKEKSLLATKLIQDIVVMIGAPEYL